VDNLGKQLRIVRERLALSLRAVARRSIVIAKERGSERYQISSSWLARIENDPKHEIGAHPLIAILAIYRITLEELLAVGNPRELPEDTSAIPEDTDNTIVLINSPAEAAARALLPDDSRILLIPESTEVLRQGFSKRNGRFLRIVIGRQRNYLYPIVPAGTVALVDTYRRSLTQAGDVEVEIQRPVFLLELRDGRHICCWCELVDRGESRAIVLPHPTGRWRAFQVVLGKDASVRGQVVVVRIPTIVTKSSEIGVKEHT
jgi:transcriptional regulator with XRE-family HTH domain